MPDVVDNNGNTLTDTSGKSYVWDFENRLTQVTVPQTGGGSNAVTFKYDPFGRRIQKSSASGTTNSTIALLLEPRSTVCEPRN